jgi:hypothetical protein
MEGEYLSSLKIIEKWKSENPYPLPEHLKADELDEEQNEKLRKIMEKAVKKGCKDADWRFALLIWNNFILEWSYRLFLGYSNKAYRKNIVEGLYCYGIGAASPEIKKENIPIFKRLYDLNYYPGKYYYGSCLVEFHKTAQEEEEGRRIMVEASQDGNDAYITLQVADNYSTGRYGFPINGYLRVKFENLSYDQETSELGLFEPISS